MSERAYHLSAIGQTDLVLVQWHNGHRVVHLSTPMEMVIHDAVAMATDSWCRWLHPNLVDALALGAADFPNHSIRFSYHSPSDTFHYYLEADKNICFILIFSFEKNCSIKIRRLCSTNKKNL